MAPEQLEGKEADGRTDVFAFGAVLYEMATGKKAFSAASQASLITAIMSADPPAISTVQPMSPPALDRVVKKCLAKDPEDRWQNAADLASELEVDRGVRLAGRGGGADHPRAAPARAARLGARRAARGDVGVPRDPACSGRGPVAGASVHAALLLPEQVGSDAMLPRAFAGRPQPSSSPRNRARRTRLHCGCGASDPTRPGRFQGPKAGAFPSGRPDGRSLGFFADRKLKRIDVAGGSAADDLRRDRGGPGRDVEPGRVIVFSAGRSTGLSRVAASGGNPEPVTKPDAAARRYQLIAGPSSFRTAAIFCTTRRRTRGPRARCSMRPSDGKENRLLARGRVQRGVLPGGTCCSRGSGSCCAQPFDPAQRPLERQPGAGRGRASAMASA